MTQRIQLISGPRNISTALMYSFGNRKDTAIVDEPFYAYYLQHTGIDHPGRAEMLATMSSDVYEILDGVIFKDRPEPYFFIKNMAHHMIDFDISYSYGLRNIFLIRDPRRLLTSFSKVIKNPTGSDIGLEREVELYRLILENGKYAPIVLDTGEVLKNPKKVLSELCDKLIIPFSSAMLEWEAGPRPEDGCWAKYWYKSVHKSTCFLPHETTEVQLPEYLLPLYQEVQPYYNFLFEKAIKA